MIAQTLDLGPLLRLRYGRPVRKLCLRVGATCPNRDGTLDLGGCIYCGEPDLKPPPPLDAQIAAGQKRLAPGTLAIAYLQDHTATHLPAERLDEILSEIRRHREIVAITIGTRPDALGRPILEVLERHARETDLLVELGLQTANDRTLALVRRKHDVSCFREATILLHERRIRVCAHVILGLPEPGEEVLRAEGPEHARATAELIAALHIEAVKIHNCHVLRGTLLADWYDQGRYRPPDLDGYLDRLIVFLEHLPPSVEVHRLVGEARFPALLAPAFTAHKSSTLRRIRAVLAERGARQGQKVRSPAEPFPGAAAVDPRRR